MSALLATAALALCVAAGFALTAAAGAALVWRLARTRIERAHPVWRARIAFALAAAPAWLPLLALGLVLAPGFGGLLGLGPDHCRVHGDHVHLCFAHPRAALTLPLAGLLAIAAGTLAVALVRRVRTLASWRRQLASLRAGATQRLAADVRLIPSERPFSVTVGLWRPEIWVSTALAEQLPRPQLDAVLAHERAHARRRDALRKLVAQALSRPQLPMVRRELLALLALASEQACDEAAALRVGDRLDVADTLLAVERLVARAPVAQHPAWAAFGGGELAARVQQLMDAAPGEPAVIGGWLLFALAVVVCAAAQPLHHATEHALGWLLRVL